MNKNSNVSTKNVIFITVAVVASIGLILEPSVFVGPVAGGLTLWGLFSIVSAFTLLLFLLFALLRKAVGKKAVGSTACFAFYLMQVSLAANIAAWFTHKITSAHGAHIGKNN